MHKMSIVVIASILILINSSLVDHTGMFTQFMNDHGRVYKDINEQKKRYNNFVNNMKQALLLQAMNEHAVFGVNKYSDKHPSELAHLHNYKFNHNNTSTVQLELVGHDALKSTAKIDYRTRGVVTDVKYQGNCDGCWAFAAVGNLESISALAGNPLMSLSVQELISCDTYDHGCNEGTVDKAFQWLRDYRNGTITTLGSYPFASADGYSRACRSNLDSLPAGAIVTNIDVLPRDEDQMAAYLYANGPISVVANAEPWLYYKNGIVTYCPDEPVNHAIVAVGYDNSNSPPYWIIKNSWGADWGENGYLRVSKGFNTCKINSHSVSAVVSKTQFVTQEAATTTTKPTSLSISIKRINVWIIAVICVSLGAIVIMVSAVV